MRRRSLALALLLSAPFAVGGASSAPCGVPLADLATEGTHFAVLVAVGEYEDDALPRLLGPANDHRR
ncbi:MAG: hypothetical protein KDA24_26165, partial [Deltaproteobacteria bacterium]|nr:hypothetical protein [Deltaproteobacteria bacterium]